MLIYILLAAGFITALLGHWIDAVVIFGVVIVNAVVGYVQEGKAEKALDAIRNLLSPKAMVRRENRSSSVPSDELVPGDIVILRSGDKVPADMRLFMTRELRVDESLLTGESVPVEKSNDVVPVTAALGDQKNMAFSGTLVTYGKGEGIVTGTGDDTELGRISTMLGSVETLVTPFLRRTEQLAKMLAATILLLSIGVFLYGILIKEFSVTEMFNATVGLAVAAIPEGLPAIMTITLAAGVQAMARRNAIIRKLPAVETLGSVTVICSDKTGTLTRNEMTVRSVAVDKHVYAVSGEGYEPMGSFLLDGTAVNESRVPELSILAHVALLCNDASLENREGSWVLSGDPTEGALVSLGIKSGYDHETEMQKWARTDVIPFESQRRFMATLHHSHENEAFIYMKGAPEAVLGRCNSQLVGNGEKEPIDHAYWQNVMGEIAGQGQRLLACAYRKADPAKQTLSFTDVDSEMTVIGLVGIIDPPRAEAVEAIKSCRRAGVQIKMITGDHAATAKAIGAMLGIRGNGSVMTGSQVEALDDADLQKIVAEVDIFARSSPEHKIRLVKALQAKGHVVAMTGDGVNDAPALKQANVGIAMGQNGTEVSKEAAEMILVDDNFATIVGAIEQGRTVYDNLKKSILFVLPTNGGEAFSILAAIAIGSTLPITALQILWVNMVTAVTLALTLAFEKSEDNVMQRKPRQPDEVILSPFIIWRIIYVSVILMTGTFGLFLWYESGGHSHETARTVAVNALVMFEIFYLFSSRFYVASAFSQKGFWGNRYALYAIGILLILQLVFVYAPFMQTLFETAPLGVLDWVYIVVVGSSVLFFVELEKFLLRRIYGRDLVM
ncbi:MAG: cation-transporting P-type ATPase [Thermodesulfobacteriota bacterium]|nr:cation-transporting P-type ATPase [Thermodesulfobacteriota bacterium]